MQGLTVILETGNWAAPRREDKAGPVRAPPYRSLRLGELRVKARLEPPMPSHKFHIGDTVTLKPAISRNVPGGV